MILRRIGHHLQQQQWTAALIELANVLKQVRAEGVAQGYALGLSAFGEMDHDRLMGTVAGRQQRAQQLPKDIDGIWARVAGSLSPKTCGSNRSGFDSGLSALPQDCNQAERILAASRQ